MRIGIVGLGKMGNAIAHNLLARGYAVSVWNRTPHHADELIAKGAVELPSIQALVDGVDTVIVMLWGDDAAREVSLGEVIPSARAGQLVIEMSTLSPDMYATLESAALKRGVAFLASPVLGSTPVAQAGSLTVLPGGEKATFERARSLFESLGSTVIYTGSVRASGFLKLANNEILAVFAETLAELLRLCAHAGVDRGVAVDLLTGTFQRVVATKTEQLRNADTEARFSLDALVKDLELAHGSAHSLDVSMPVLDTVLPEMQAAVERGLGEKDFIAVALQ